ncbi:unnamed protein product [Trichobilharzia regenti]|nr:unnamed protein product [Trichobilharzia regenti]
MRDINPFRSSSVYKEKQELAQQMEKLSKRKMETESLRQSLCSNCRTPVRESGPSNLRIRHKLGSGNAGGINNGVKQVSALHNDVKTGNGTWVDFCQLRASQDQVSIHFRQSDIPHSKLFEFKIRHWCFSRTCLLHSFLCQMPS